MQSLQWLMGQEEQKWKFGACQVYGRGALIKYPGFGFGHQKTTPGTGQKGTPAIHEYGKPRLQLFQSLIRLGHPGLSVPLI